MIMSEGKVSDTLNYPAQGDTKSPYRKMDQKQTQEEKTSFLDLRTCSQSL